MASDGLMNVYFSHSRDLLPFQAGGILGSLVEKMLVQMANSFGASIILLTFLLTGVTLATGVSWLGLLEKMGQYALRGSAWFFQRTLRGLYFLRGQFTRGMRQFCHRCAHFLAFKASGTLTRKMSPVILESAKKASKKSSSLFDEPSMSQCATPEGHQEVTEHLLDCTEPEHDMDRALKPVPSRFESFDLLKSKMPQEQSIPSLRLLDDTKSEQRNDFSPERLEALSFDVEKRLRDFGVSATVVAVYPGPVITRLELSLAPGVKVSKVSGLSKDLARSLSITSVRIVDVIPGKSVIGLEIPNAHRAIVRLKEILRTEPYEQSLSPLSLALGKDIAGHPVVVDLAKMPHLLVAGTTGSGKSVSLNTMILSLLTNQPQKKSA